MPTTDTSPRKSASPTDAEHATTDEIATHRGDVTTDARGDGLDRLRAGLVCGFVPVGQVRPLLELLDVLRRAGGAEDRATVMYPGGEPLDLACRNGYVAASLLPALRVYQTLAGSS